MTELCLGKVEILDDSFKTNIFKILLHKFLNIISRKGFEGFELDDTSEQNISKLESGWERARLAP